MLGEHGSDSRVDDSLLFLVILEAFVSMFKISTLVFPFVGEQLAGGMKNIITTCKKEKQSLVSRLVLYSNIDYTKYLLIGVEQWWLIYTWPDTVDVVADFTVAATLE